MFQMHYLLTVVVSPSSSKKASRTIEESIGHIVCYMQVQLYMFLLVPLFFGFPSSLVA